MCLQLQPPLISNTSVLFSSSRHEESTGFCQHFRATFFFFWHQVWDYTSVTFPPASELSETGHSGLWEVTKAEGWVQNAALFCQDDFPAFSLPLCRLNRTQLSQSRRITSWLRSLLPWVPLLPALALHGSIFSCPRAPLPTSPSLPDAKEWNALADDGDVLCCHPIQTRPPFCSGQETTCSLEAV